MSIKSAITAVLLLSAATLPALAEDYAHDPARADAPAVQQAPLLGGVVAAEPGTVKTAKAANAPTQTDVAAGSSVPAFSTNPHMYDYLSGPEYRGGD